MSSSPSTSVRDAQRPATVTVESLQHRLDTRTKPQGSLGSLEPLAIQIGLALDTETPVFHAPHAFVFAGDHGIAVDGVSAFPQAVTAQMLLNYLNGGAAINVLARQYGLALVVTDAGIAADPIDHPALSRFGIARGTRNYRLEPAMTQEQCERAIDAARTLASNALSQGSNALLLGEMGIGNTASAALLLHSRTGWALEECVGRGTGLDDTGLLRKRALLRESAQRRSRPETALEALSEFGGFEIAALVGALLATVDHRCIAVIDGFTVSVAAMLAIEMDPRVRSHCIFSHCSAETAHRKLLQRLNARPILDLEMRLGEGSGAALAWPVIDATARLMTNMASFESAGVSDRS
jgi:nicotinate-nucleotide--dimethylbenzimidazole phosphoribosyltransferase